MSLTLQGFPVSPFVRAARVALLEKGVAHGFTQIGFEHLATEEYARLNPFRRMPVLLADGFTLYETPAILRYLDETGPGPSLTPETARERAQMTKWLSIASSYLFPTGVMQVFVERMLKPIMGGTTDEAVVASAAEGLGPQLDVLETELRGPGLFGDRLTLADILVGCMLELPALTPEGTALVAARPRVATFLAWLHGRDSFRSTFPELLGSVPA